VALCLGTYGDLRGVGVPHERRTPVRLCLFTGLRPQMYRGALLIRKRTPLGPYRRPLSRVLLGVRGGWAFFYGSGTPISLVVDCLCLSSNIYPVRQGCVDRMSDFTIVTSTRRRFRLRVPIPSALSVDFQLAHACLKFWRPSSYAHSTHCAHGYVAHRETPPPTGVPRS